MLIATSLCYCVSHVYNIVCYAQLAKMSFDKIFGLTAAVYFFYSLK